VEYGKLVVDGTTEWAFGIQTPLECSADLPAAPRVVSGGAFEHLSRQMDNVGPDLLDAQYSLIQFLRIKRPGFLQEEPS
jgi:hypothetical protein